MIWREIFSENKPKGKETYCTEAKRGCPNKKLVNTKLAELSKNNREMAIILDASTFQTRKALMKVGYKKDNIIIPNPFDYEKMKKNNLRVLNMYLGELLSKPWLYNKSISVAFFDYCCTYSGNEKVKPKNDIRDYFKNKLAKNDSVFAVTFSRRDCKTKGDVIHKARIFIYQTAKKYGYRAVRVWQREYNDHGPMFVLMYKVYTK